MLKLLNGQDNPVLNIDNFYIDELWSGLDELVFDIPITDPAYKSILEEAVVEYEQPYLVKAIDGGSSTAKPVILGRLSPRNRIPPRSVNNTSPD